MYFCKGNANLATNDNICVSRCGKHSSGKSPSYSPECRPRAPCPASYGTQGPPQGPRQPPAGSARTPGPFPRRRWPEWRTPPPPCDPSYSVSRAGRQSRRKSQSVPIPAGPRSAPWLRVCVSVVYFPLVRNAGQRLCKYLHKKTNILKNILTCRNCARPYCTSNKIHASQR